MTIATQTIGGPAEAGPSPDGPASIVLGREELFLLVRLLPAATIPGLDPAPLLNLARQELAAAMASAQHSLLARDLVQVGPEAMTPDAATAALLRVCAAPDVTLVAVVLRDTPAVDVRYIHAGADLIVEHALAKPFAHTFTPLPDRSTSLQRMAEALHLPVREAASCPSGRISGDALMRAGREARTGDIAAAQAILVEGDLALATAAALAATLRAPVTNASCTAIDHRSKQAGGFALVDGTGGLWLLEVEADPTVVRVAPVDAAMIRARLAALWPDASAHPAAPAHFPQ